MELHHWEQWKELVMGVEHLLGAFLHYIPPIFRGGGKNSVLAEDQEASWILDSVPWKLESAVEVLQFGGSVTQWAALSFPNGLF